MNVQIGDTVLVTLAGKLGGPIYSGLTYANKPCAAIVTGVYWENLISCCCFKLEGEMQFIKQLSHKSLVDKGHSYCDFRPSQKEPPIPEPPRNLSEVLKDALKNIDVEITDEKSIEKLIEERYGRDLEIKNQGIKLHPSLLKPPAVGTFEWALVALKNGHKVRRLSWKPFVILCLVEGRLPFALHDIDLLATNWVLA